MSCHVPRNARSSEEVGDVSHVWRKAILARIVVLAGVVYLIAPLGLALGVTAWVLVLVLGTPAALAVAGAKLCDMDTCSDEVLEVRVNVRAWVRTCVMYVCVCVCTGVVSPRQLPPPPLPPRPSVARETVGVAWVAPFALAAAFAALGLGFSVASLAGGLLALPAVLYVFAEAAAMLCGGGGSTLRVALNDDESEWRSKYKGAVPRYLALAGRAGLAALWVVATFVPALVLSLVLLPLAPCCLCPTLVAPLGTPASARRPLGTFVAALVFALGGAAAARYAGGPAMSRLVLARPRRAPRCSAGAACASRRSVLGGERAGGGVGGEEAVAVHRENPGAGGSVRRIGRP